MDMHKDMEEQRRLTKTVGNAKTREEEKKREVTASPALACPA